MPGGTGRPTISSRFAGLSRARAGCVAVLLLAVLTFSLWPAAQGPGAAPGIATATGPHNADLFLYEAINERVARGEDYYPAAAVELRTRSFPLRPFVTFRLPTLAWIQASLGPPLTKLLYGALAAATLAAWWFRFAGGFAVTSRRGSATLLVGAGLAIAASPGLIVLHELWAGMLVALSLALWRPERWLPSVGIALIAVLIRELAVPFVLLMMALALWHQRWTEGAAWVAVTAVFVAAILVHQSYVVPMVLPNDPVSPPWLTVGGWPTFMRAFRLTSALRVLPDAIGTTGIVLAFFGWLSSRSEIGLRASLLYVGYALAFMIAGRPNNFYWGLMVAPAFLAGLMFLPQAFTDLVQSLHGGSPLDSSERERQR
jgi:hypothetical protein